MRYCLDTNIIIDIFRGDQALQAKISALDPRQTCITPIALAELFKGAHLAQKKNEALALVEIFSRSVELLDFSEEACALFGEYYARLAKQGKLTQESDLMIGCIALAHDAVLVTRNAKDFTNISGLKTVVW
jgi:tRNA(fMet)-specific endonuclease VapC